MTRPFFCTLAAMLLIAGQAAALEKPRDWTPPPPEQVPNHRAEWRFVVTELANYAKARRKDFAVVVRGGIDMVIKGDREAHWEELQDPTGKTFEKRLPVGATFRPYVKVIDGLILDGFYCGADAFGRPVSAAIDERLKFDKELAEERARGVYRPPVPQNYGPFSIDPEEERRKAAATRREMRRQDLHRRELYAINALRQSGRPVFSIEACESQKEVDQAMRDGERDHILPYASVGNTTFNKPPRGHPRHENAAPVSTLTQVRNWYPMLRADQYGTRAEWVMELERSNHDMLVVDVAHRGMDGLTAADIKKLRYKALGSPRMVMAHMSIGKAFDWRWYWQKGWETGNPAFLFAPDGDAPGTFMVFMSDPKWKELLGKYITAIVDVGFDGVVLDDLDTYLWFEDLMPLGPTLP